MNRDEIFGFVVKSIVVLFVLALLVYIVGSALIGQLPRNSEQSAPTPTRLYTEAEVQATVAAAVRESEPNSSADITSISESDEMVTANITVDSINATLDQLFEFEDTASAEAALMSRYNFSREQVADFNGGMNHWTSGRGSCGSPDRDPADSEYCRFRYLISEDTLVAFVIDATGVYFENRDHVTEFIVTNVQPYSVKDGGLLSLHTTMTEEDVRLAIVSRLFWANRPGMTRDDAVATGPTRTLAIRNEMGR